MKTIVTLLCLAFIAFSVPAFAQNQPPAVFAQDTLIIKLQDRNHVYIIGQSLKNLTEYKRADSLKNLYFEDLQKMFAANNFPETPNRIHYLINQNGKRRLKAEIPGETESIFDLEYEKKRMKQDLPVLHYTIYDLPANVEIHFFLADKTAFETVAKTSLDKAVQEVHKDRKKLTGLSAYRLEQNSFGFEKRNPSRRQHLRIEATASCGALLLGNQLSPVISPEIFITLPHIPASSFHSLRFGFSYNTFVLTDFTDGQFRGLNPGTYWHLIIQSDLGLEKDQWFGISMGQISNKNANGLPDHAFKAGFIFNYNRDSFSFDSIKLEKNIFKANPEKPMLMFTYKRTIF